MGAAPLADVLVVDRSEGIAGGYCAKLLADAGAGLEREPGTPSRLPEHLVPYLRVGSGTSGAGRRAVVVADGVPDVVDLAEVRRRWPRAVVVAITPFGLEGPRARTPATEFTLQAWCGSLGGRGLPEREPLQAGGRLVEWAAGTYAAVAAAAALRSGWAETVDVSMFECGVLTMNMYSYLAAAFGDRAAGAGRAVEVPSILPTSDGHVGVCTVTAQQFEDLLVMIDRPDLLADEELRQAGTRFARRDEFLAAVHAWSTARTTAEVLDLADAFRVPAAPLGHGADVLGFDHFVERRAFVAAGDVVVPRRPYRIMPGPVARRPERRLPGSPLGGVRVLDLTAFLAGPSATHVLAALGADVVKVEGPRRPDGMRASSARRDDDRWLEWGSVFHGVNAGKRSVAIDLADERGRQVALRLVEQADVVIENFTPRVLDNLRLTSADLVSVNPGVVLVRMPAYGLDGPWRDRPGFAQNMEQVSGLAAVTGYVDGPPLLPRGPCDPIAGMHAAFATLVALADRRRTGRGATVEVAMSEAILAVAADALLQSQVTGEVTRLGNGAADARPQGVHACAGDEQWLALSVRSDDEWQAVRGVLGGDLPADRHAAVDGPLGRALASRPLGPTVAALAAAGVPAAPVVLPRALLDDEQLAARAFFEPLAHPVVGEHRFPTVPFRYASRDRPWLGRPAPCHGQHTDEVLLAAGLTVDEVDELRRAGVVA